MTNKLRNMAQCKMQSHLIRKYGETTTAYNIIKEYTEKLNNANVTQFDNIVKESMTR